MTPQKAVRTLSKKGLTQEQIVKLLKGKKVKTTQATICRISKGSHKNPGYELGAALIALAEEWRDKKTIKVAV